MCLPRDGQKHVVFVTELTEMQPTTCTPQHGEPATEPTSHAVDRPIDCQPLHHGPAAPEGMAVIRYTELSIARSTARPAQPLHTS